MVWLLEFWASPVSAWKRLGCFGGFGMDGDAGDLREAFLDVVFKCGENVVDARDRVIALHDAVAGDEDVVVNLADADIVAIKELVVIAVQMIEVGFDSQLELAHFSGADFGRGNVPAEGLDVNVDIEFETAVPERPNGVFKLGGATMRFAERKVFVDLEVQLHENIPVLLEGGNVVDGMPHALRDGTNRFEEIFVVRSAGLGVDDDVRGDDLADSLFDGVGERVDLFEICRARN